MPDKRQTSKQRRAARNRAAREALAARRTHAVASSTGPGSTRASRASGAAGSPTGAAAASATNGRTVRGTRRGGFLGNARGRRRPGDMAVLVALGLSVVSAISMLFLRVPVDDRGEPLPRTFRGVAIAAREAVTGQEMPDRDTSLLDANGASVLLYIALPVAVAAFAFWANRRPDRGRLLTFAMLAMAGAVLLGGGFFFFPSLIALGVASFQIRKADMPARVAERAASRGGRGGVIDAESEESDGEPTDDDIAGDTYDTYDTDEADADDAPDTDDATEAADDPATAESEGGDPLAELEAEIEAEEQARKGRGRGARGGATSAE